MNEKIFMKSKSHFWGKHPYICLTLAMMLGIILYFWLALFVCPISLITINIFLFFVIFTIGTLYCNNRYHMPESMAFILRDNTLYAIQLIYASVDPHGDEVIGVSHFGEDLPAADYAENIETASKVQNLEKKVAVARYDASNYFIALDNILSAKKRHKYVILSDDKRSPIGRYCHTHWQNAKFERHPGGGFNYNFIMMNSPSVIRSNKIFFRVKYTDSNGKDSIATFSNFYDGLIDAIQTMSKQ